MEKKEVADAILKGIVEAIEKQGVVVVDLEASISGRDENEMRDVVIRCGGRLAGLVQRMGEENGIDSEPYWEAVNPNRFFDGAATVLDCAKFLRAVCGAAIKVCDRIVEAK